MNIQEVYYAKGDVLRAKKLIIAGWSGEYEIQPLTSNTTVRVEIEAPERVQGERWTFQRVDRHGNLKCYSSLVGTQQLPGKNNPRSGKPWTKLIIRVSPERIDFLEVVVRNSL